MQGSKACFNFANISRPVYCAKHKQSGMLDVVSARCRAAEDLISVMTIHARHTRAEG